MFSADDIRRARNIVKVATALAPSAAAPAPPSRVPRIAGAGYEHNALAMPERPSKASPAPAPSQERLVDPYQYNNQSYWNPNVKELGWNPPNQPTFLGSAGKSIAGLAMGPFDYVRSMVGLSPGRSQGRNWLGGAPMYYGGKLLGLPKWQQQGQAHMTDGGIGWAAPYGRAMDQSKEYRQALPQYMEKHFPLFSPKWRETLENWGTSNFGSEFPYP